MMEMVPKESFPLPWWSEGSITVFGNCVSFFLFYQSFLFRWDLQIGPLISTYLLLTPKLARAQKNVPRMDCGFSGSLWLLENHRPFRSYCEYCSCLGTTPLLPETTQVLFNPMERQRIKRYFKQSASNMTHKSFKSQYTVYTELKKALPPCKNSASGFPGSPAVPGGCKETSPALVSCAGKVLGRWRLTVSQRKLRTEGRWGWDAEGMPPDSKVSGIFITAPHILILLMFRELVL